MSIGAGYPAEGEMIGPYRIVRRIGGGGMGEVFEADDAALDRRVALKVISPHLTQSPDFRARFTREAQALASLDSANVVHVYAHGDADGCLYLATQLVPDGDLGNLIANLGAQSIRVALDLAGQVAAGLVDAHAAGLIHRDIKPANVLLRGRDDAIRAYLGDFGIARQVDAEHTHPRAHPRTHSRGGAIGTPSYMAPELHTGGTAGVTSDVYSLGCLLWATLSGRAPYRGTSEFQIVSAHLEQPIPQLRGHSPMVDEVNRILRTAMAKQPADRYRSAALLRDDLRRAKSLPDSGAGANAGVGPIPAVAPRRIALVAVAALVVSVIGAVAFGLTRGDDDRRNPPATAPTLSSAASGSTTDGSTTRDPSGAEQAAAIASLAQALEDQGVLTGAQARCSAERWIEEAGLRAMIGAGFFDEDLAYVDQGRDQMTPEIEAAAQSAAIACAAPAGG